MSPGLVRLESALWQTTSLLLLDGAQSVAIDPCISADEIDAVRAAAARLSAEFGYTGDVEPRVSAAE